MPNKLFTALVAMAVTVCLAQSSMAQETLKIGVGGAHSGDLASYGLPTVNAVKLVVDDYNAKGGVLGKKIEIVTADDQCKPEVATNAATKLVSEGVKFVVGQICSGATKSALPIYKDAQVLAISPSATDDSLTYSGNYPNFFRTIAPNAPQAFVQVDFVLGTLGKKNVAVIHDKGDYGKGIAEVAKERIEKSGKGKVVLFEGVTPGAVDYSAIVNKLKQSKAEAVIFGGYHPEASKIVNQLRKKKMDIPFVSDDGVKDDTFIKVAGESAEGVYATAPRDVSKNPLAIASVQAHKDKFGSEPGVFFLNAYAATQALLNGIAKAGSTDFGAVKKALMTEPVDTPLGKIKFDERGDAEGVGYSVYQVQQGKYVELK